MKSSDISMMQLESALNHLQNGAYGEDGEMILTKEWFERYDGLIKQLISSRALLDSQKQQSSVDWHKITELLES